MKHKLTQQDVDKMKAEIEHRKVEVRPELLEHVKEARAHGDLSENFEYHAAKKEKNRNFRWLAGILPCVFRNHELRFLRTECNKR